MARARRIDSVATRWLAGCVALFALGIGASARAEGEPLKKLGTCMSDGDCAAGYECDLGPSVGRDCTPDDGACDATPQEPRIGECEPSEMTCDVDADCVAGLTCEHHDSDGDCAVAVPPAIDGGAATPVPPDCEPSEPSRGECVYELVGCKKDSDCDDGLVCTAIGSTSECSSADPAPCAPGEECTKPPSDCVETTQSYCFPPRVDCSSDDDCEDGTRCAALSEDAQEDPPPSWEGATALCLPEAIALVLEGRVDASGATGGSKSSNDSAVAAGDEAPRMGGDNGADADDATNDDDGCAVSAPGACGERDAWLLLLSAAAVLGRRRFATKRR